MHNAQCRGNGVAEPAVVAELVEATHNGRFDKLNDRRHVERSGAE